MFINKYCLIGLLALILTLSAAFYMQLSVNEKTNKTLAVTVQNLKAKNDTLHILRYQEDVAYKQLAYLSEGLIDTVKYFSKVISKDASEIISLNKTIVDLKKERDHGTGTVTGDSLLTYKNYNHTDFIKYDLEVQVDTRSKKGSHSLTKWIDPFEVISVVYVDKNGDISSAVEFTDTNLIAKSVHTIVNSKYVPPIQIAQPLYPSIWARFGLYANTNFDTFEGGLVFRPLTFGYDNYKKIHFGVNATFYELYRDFIK